MYAIKNASETRDEISRVYDGIALDVSAMESDSCNINVPLDYHTNTNTNATISTRAILKTILSGL